MSKGKNQLNFTFRVVKNGRVVDRCQTHSKRRFYNRIGTLKWQNKPSFVYLRVSYGKNIDAFGKMVNFYNDGEYDNKNDLLSVLDIFSQERI
jgi:hypothetical protein